MKFGGQVAKPIKYGYVGGGRVTLEYPVAASQVFVHTGGAFVKLDANKRCDIADSGDAELLGWADTGAFTASATAGVTIVPVIISVDSLFLLPTDVTRTEAQLRALVGETCDLIVATNVQYADVGESNEDVIQIMGYQYYDASNQAVVVRMNPNKLAATGVV